MIRLDPPKSKEMRKTLSIDCGVIRLIIEDAPVEVALPEIEAIKGAEIIAAANGRIHAVLYTKGDAALMAKAKELIANGWGWRDEGCTR